MLNKILDFLNRKPQISYIQPKVLNLYFSNSLDKKFNNINLFQYDRYSFFINQQKEHDNNIFILTLELNKNSLNETINIAIFETRKEAEDALSTTKIKIYSTEKKIVRFVFISFLILFTFDMFNSVYNSTKNMTTIQNTAENSQLPVIDQSYVLQQYQNKILEEQNKKNASLNSQHVPNEDSVNLPVEPDSANNFITKLK